MSSTALAALPENTAFSENEIAALFARLKKNNDKALIPFILAGYPSWEITEALLFAAQRAGADLIELGIPFSDPYADGPVIAQAHHQALKDWQGIADLLTKIKALRQKNFSVPLILFTYLNPVLAFRVENFIREAKAAGVQGALVTELPPEHAECYLKSAKEQKFATVFLCSPSTDVQRLDLINQAATGFVYCISSDGVTGVRRSLAEGLQERLLFLRKKISRPLALGFGISSARQAAQAAPFTDGVIIGSALISLYDQTEALRKNSGISAVQEFLTNVKSALKTAAL